MLRVVGQLGLEVQMAERLLGVTQGKRGVEPPFAQKGEKRGNLGAREKRRRGLVGLRGVDG